ncbi:LuxR C-terminal-related transcriptional regulator [Variovorax sp. HW608]|uniref:LuxR C-terminal-related transcriptional regulator n=1 Tax=Variovorax sp. HW608 TaxID=1034889 RepID=UPI001E28DB2A|nr:LuxR C-terminal-related transcriptional regulator [Variovorax sp. HW608]
MTDCLDLAGLVKLVLVRAPAGFGKTTAMVQLRESLQERGVATAWLTLDRADNDVPRFLASLSAAATQLGLECPAGGSPDVFSLLAAEQAPFALFLDDVEVIRSSGVADILKELLERLPRNGLLVVASRNLPDLGLGRLRARNHLLELDSELLRFTAEETADFFRLRGAGLFLEATDRAHEKTEGWAAALWLLSIALHRNSATGDVLMRLSDSDRDVADYLTEEVMSRQAPVVRNFLLRTSVLRQLSVPTCQALLPNVDCAAMLCRLAHDNAFLIPIESAPLQFRYHALFADFLRKLLVRERPEEVARLNLAASGAYESQDRPVPAIDHAIEGGDFPHALHLLEKNAHILLEQGRMRLLDRWYSAMPAELLRRMPLMQVIAVWARCFSQGPWIAMECLQASNCMSSRDEQVSAHIRALLPVLLAMMDRYEEAHDAGRAALGHPPSGNCFIDSVLPNAMAHIVSVAGDSKEAHLFLEDARRAQGPSAFNRMYTETVGGMLDLREGRLRQATARFRLAITSSSTAATYNYAHGNAWAGVPYAAVLYEANDLVGAERLLNVYLPLARDVGLPDHMITSYRLRARISFHHGDVDTALQTITDLEYLGHRRKLPRVTSSAKLERSRILLLQGHASAAREELMRADDRTAWTTSADRQARPAQEVDDLLISRVRVELYLGNAASQVPRLEAEMRSASLLKRHQRILKLRLLLALSLLRAGDVERAVEEAISVLLDSSREGFFRLILDEGPLLGALIRRVLESSSQAIRDPIFREYLERLLEHLGLTPTEDERPLTDGKFATEHLSRSEIRVLELLAEGYSNTAMTEILLVSNSTVRTHLRNIYTKLDCHNRIQAVAIGRRSGLIR